MSMTCRNKHRDKEPTVSRIVKIVSASVAVLALIAIGSPASAAVKITPMGGGVGCCVSFN